MPPPSPTKAPRDGAATPPGPARGTSTRPSGATNRRRARSPTACGRPPRAGARRPDRRRGSAPTARLRLEDDAPGALPRARLGPPRPMGPSEREAPGGGGAAAVIGAVFPRSRSHMKSSSDEARSARGSRCYHLRRRVRVDGPSGKSVAECEYGVAQRIVGRRPGHGPCCRFHVSIALGPRVAFIHSFLGQNLRRVEERS